MIKKHYIFVEIRDTGTGNSVYIWNDSTKNSNRVLKSSIRRLRLPVFKVNWCCWFSHLWYFLQGRNKVVITDNSKSVEHVDSLKGTARDENRDTIRQDVIRKCLSYSVHLGRCTSLWLADKWYYEASEQMVLHCVAAKYHGIMVVVVRCVKQVCFLRCVLWDTHTQHM